MKEKEREREHDGPIELFNLASKPSEGLKSPRDGWMAGGGAAGAG